MKRREVTWTWEDPDAQQAFAQLVGFPGREETAAQIDRIEALLGLEPPLKILDVGCGTGRHAIELARRGHAVTAIDVAAGYLAQARADAASQGVRVEFRRQRGSELGEQGQYDLALAFWHTLGFMEDEEIDRHFRCILSALAPAGRLLLVLADPKLVPGATFEPVRVWEERGTQFVLTHQVMEDGYRYERCIVIDTKKDELIEYHERHRAFSLADVREILSAAGFGHIRCLKDLEGAPATPAEFGVFVCARRDPCATASPLGSAGSPPAG